MKYIVLISSGSEEQLILSLTAQNTAHAEQLVAEYLRTSGLTERARQDRTPVYQKMLAIPENEKINMLSQEFE
jgi:predicted lactoylglutathione lyase